MPLSIFVLPAKLKYIPLVMDLNRSYFNEYLYTVSTCLDASQLLPSNKLDVVIDVIDASQPIDVVN